jgi:hypothetical protein
VQAHAEHRTVGLHLNRHVGQDIDDVAGRDRLESIIVPGVRAGTPEVPDDASPKAPRRLGVGIENVAGIDPFG